MSRTSRPLHPAAACALLLIAGCGGIAMTEAVVGFGLRTGLVLCGVVTACVGGAYALLAVTPLSADPDDPRYGDQDRDVGDPAGMPRVELSHPVPVFGLLLVMNAGLVGLLCGLALALVSAWSLGSGALVGGLAGAALGGAVVIAARGRLP